MFEFSMNINDTEFKFWLLFFDVIILILLILKIIIDNQNKSCPLGAFN